VSTSGALRLLVDALAVYRGTKLVIDDKLTEDLRARVTARFGDADESKVGYLITCPWCVSIYLGGALSVARIVAPSSKTVDAVATALALSAITGVLYEREDSF
jgi:hypothetical protein